MRFLVLLTAGVRASRAVPCVVLDLPYDFSTSGFHTLCTVIDHFSYGFDTVFDLLVLALFG